MERKKSAVVYTITLDPETGLPVEILESVVATCLPEPGSQQVQYYVFATRFRLDAFDAVERFEVPPEAKRAWR